MARLFAFVIFPEIFNIRPPVIDFRTRRSEIPTSFRFMLFFAVVIILAYVLLLPDATVSVIAALLGALTGSSPALDFSLLVLPAGFGVVLLLP